MAPGAHLRAISIGRRGQLAPRCDIEDQVSDLESYGVGCVLALD
jgi:hypothetical protein